MSNRLFQGIVHQMTDVIERTFGVIDETGTVISCSELGKIGEVQSNAVTEVFSVAENKIIDGYTYKVFGSHMHPVYAVFVEGDDYVAEKYPKAPLWIASWDFAHSCKALSKRPPSFISPCPMSKGLFRRTTPT